MLKTEYFCKLTFKKYSVPRSLLYLPKLELKLKQNFIELYQNLNNHLKSKIYFRNYPYTNYLETLTNEELSNEIPNVKFDDENKYISIKKSAILIFNGLSTMMLEIINLKPFLLFDPDDYFIDKNLLII